MTGNVPQEQSVGEHAVHYLEFVTTDVQATSDFYADAWHFEPEAPELGNARVATLPDKYVPMGFLGGVLAGGKRSRSA